MTRPTVVVLCEHGETKPHWEGVSTIAWPIGFKTPPRCPGGRVLNQAIIIERDTDGNWPEATAEVIHGFLVERAFLADSAENLDRVAFAVLDALASAQENQQ